MKVLIVNTSECTGGAAVAADRLCDALNNNGVKARMLVRDKQTDNITVASCGNKLQNKWNFLWERFFIWLHLHLKRTHLFEIDIANCGIDITKTREFKEADVIHLHWVNQGLLSLRGIRKILQSGKPVVWTMHDMWPATGICHLTLGCRRFTTSCRNCPLLPGNGSNNDLSTRVWQKKMRLLQGEVINFVTCSRWLEGEARRSALLKEQTVISIPNPIDTRVYCPGNRKEARLAEGLPAEGHLILFICQRVSNPNKGMPFLIDACRQLVSEHPEMTENTTLVVLGSHAEDVAEAIPFRIVAPGYVTDEHRLVNLYRAADLFVLPSLSENLPNTIMEAMACGVPCVGFRIGGIPEEIDHKKNGYVATYRDATDLAQGIYWILYEADRELLAAEAIRKVAQNFSQTSVAVRYTELYQQAIAQKHLKL